MEQLFIRMKRYAANMLESKNLNGTLNFPTEGINFTMSMTQRRDLYLIFKEAVNYLAKYSAAQNAVIRTAVEEHCIKMLVQDDGNGFDIKKSSPWQWFDNYFASSNYTEGITMGVHSYKLNGTIIKDHLSKFPDAGGLKDNSKSKTDYFEIDYLTAGTRLIKYHINNFEGASARKVSKQHYDNSFMLPDNITLTEQ